MHAVCGVDSDLADGNSILVQDAERIELDLGTRGGLGPLLGRCAHSNRVHAGLEVILGKHRLLTLRRSSVGIHRVDNFAINRNLERTAIAVLAGDNLNARTGKGQRCRLGTRRRIQELDGASVVVGILGPITPTTLIDNARILIVDHTGHIAQIHDIHSRAQLTGGAMGDGANAIRDLAQEVICLGIGEGGFLKVGNAGHPVAVANLAHQSIGNIRARRCLNGIPRKLNRIVGSLHGAQARRSGKLGRRRNHAQRIHATLFSLKRNTIVRENLVINRIARSIRHNAQRASGGIDGSRTAVARLNGCRSQGQLFPVHGYNEVTAGNKTLDRSALPCRRQGGQHIDIATAALEEHLVNTRRSAKVAIDLEGATTGQRMQVPEIGVDAVLKLIAQQLVSTIAVAKVGPGVDALAHAPTGALIGSKVHRHTGSREPLRGIHGNQRSGEQAEHMGHMTMAKALAQRIAVRVLVKGPLGVPLLDLAIGANLNRSAQIVKLLLPNGQDLGGLAHNLAGLDSIMEKLPDERLLIGIAGGTRTVLGRIRWRRDILAIAIANEQLGIQLRFLAKRRVDIALQVLGIARLAIGIIGVLENPGHGRRRPAPVKTPARAGPAKRRVLRMGHEAVGFALGALDASIDLGGHTAGLTQAVDIGDEWLGRLRKIRGVHRPVVHLQVDIHVVVGSPRRIHEVVPHALQVAGELGVLTRGRNGQIATILVKHGLEQAALGLGSGTVVVCLEQLVGRLVRRGGIAQAQVDTAHERAHVGNMIGTNGVVPLAGGSVCRSLNASVQLLARLARAICRVVVLIIRCRGNEE